MDVEKIKREADNKWAKQKALGEAYDDLKEAIALCKDINQKKLWLYEASKLKREQQKVKDEAIALYRQLPEDPPAELTFKKTLP